MNIAGSSARLLILAALLNAGLVFAENATRPAAATNSRPSARSPSPRICLALSGGGARGYAHLGVLRQLEAMRIPVHCIAGTSMGAVIGALYASGMSADGIERTLSEVDLSDIAFDRNARPDLPQTSREDSFQYPIDIPAGFGEGTLKLSGGLVQGTRFTALMRTATSQYPGDVDFDRLPIAFRAVAADLENGEQVALRHGSLALAVRASMAVPGLFAPVVMQGRTLIDGGIASNLPIDVARQMGADVVIAVDVGTLLSSPDQLHSMAAVTTQAMRVMMNRNVMAQKAQMRPPDVLLEPQLDQVSFSDFGEMQRGIAAGRESARQSAERLAALSLDEAGYAAWRAGLPHDAALPPDTRIDRIEIVTQGRVPAQVVEQAIHVKEGDRYDPASLDRALSQLTNEVGMGTASQTLVGPEGSRTLRVEAADKSWGPHLLMFGLGFSTNFQGEGAFTVRLGHRLPWITDSGLSWRNDLVLGSRDLGLRTELRQPVFSNYYLAPYAAIERKNIYLYLNNDRTAPPIASAVQQEARAGLDLGVPLGNWGELRAGIAQVRTSYESKSSYLTLIRLPDGSHEVRPEELPLSTVNQTVARLGIKIDQLDDPTFPRTGVYLDARAEKGIAGSSGYSIAHARSLLAASYGPFSLNAGFEVGGPIGDNRDSPSYRFSLGGFQRLSAYPQDKFSGENILYGRLSGLAQLGKADSGPLRRVFAGVSLEAGNVWNSSTNRARSPWLSDVSLFFGATTSVGPVYVGVAMAPGGVRSLYLQLGNQF